jgi:phosphoglucomutase
MNFLGKKLPSADLATKIKTVIGWEEMLGKGSDRLLPAALHNIRSWRAVEDLPPWAADAIDWLLAGGHWKELNDRFFKDLEFGTGGMRGRSIGDTVAKSEGDGAANDFRHSAVGSNTLNDINVARATIALFRHCKLWLGKSADRSMPRLAIAYDVRYFSRRFAEVCAGIWDLLGGKALTFDAPRSTPQLSFAVRHLRATAGVVITASHNPYCDNGFKA